LKAILKTELLLLMLGVARGSEATGGTPVKITHLLSSAIGVPLITSVTLKVEYHLNLRKGMTAVR